MDLEFGVETSAELFEEEYWERHFKKYMYCNNNNF